MYSQLVKVMVPPVVNAPRGAQWAAAIAVWIGRVVGGRRGKGASAGTGKAKSAAAQGVKRLAAKGAA